MELLHAAELALGYSPHIMADWLMRRSHGWHYYWTPETPVRLATKQAQKLIWC